MQQESSRGKETLCAKSSKCSQAKISTWNILGKVANDTKGKVAKEDVRSIKVAKIDGNSSLSERGRRCGWRQAGMFFVQSRTLWIINLALQRFVTILSQVKWWMTTHKKQKQIYCNYHLSKHERWRITAEDWYACSLLIPAKCTNSFHLISRLFFRQPSCNLRSKIQLINNQNITHI